MRSEAVERNPEFRVAARREGKRTGQYANNRVGCVVQIHGLPHHVAPRAETLEPGSVAQEHDVWTAWPILAGTEIAPQHGMYTEGLEKAAAHALGLHRLRTR